MLDARRAIAISNRRPARGLLPASRFIASTDQDVDAFALRAAGNSARFTERVWGVQDLIAPPMPTAPTFRADQLLLFRHDWCHAYFLSSGRS
jgi:hypothetical protein